MLRVLFLFLLTPLLASAQSAAPTPAPTGRPASLFQQIVYSRVDAPNGSVWVNDGNGLDYFLTDGQIPKISTNGWHMLYMKNTVPASPCLGGLWTRRDMTSSIAGGQDTTLFTSFDYMVGYDFKDSDSSIVNSYFSCLYRMSYNTLAPVSICNNTFDDGPDLRQSDGLIAYHNVNQSLFTVQPNGTQRTPIPNTTAFDMWPTWSPDGQWLLFGRSSAFYTHVSDYPFHIANYYKIHPDGTSLTALTTFPTTDSARFVGGGAWSPDGQSITVGGTLNGRHGLWAIKADGSNLIDSIPTASHSARINFVGSGANHVFPSMGLPTDLTTAATLSPNPASTSASLTLLQPTTGTGTLRVLDALGRPVRQLAISPGTRQIELPVTSLPAGLYVCQWQTPLGTATRRLYVQH